MPAAGEGQGPGKTDAAPGLTGDGRQPTTPSRTGWHGTRLPDLCRRRRGRPTRGRRDRHGLRRAHDDLSAQSGPGCGGGVSGALFLTGGPGGTVKPFIAAYLLLMGLIILRRALQRRGPAAPV